MKNKNLFISLTLAALGGLPLQSEALQINSGSQYLMNQAKDMNTVLPQPLAMLDFPSTAYVNDPDLRFSIDFVSPRTVRIRMLTKLAQNTGEMDWGQIELKVYAADAIEATGLVCLPSDNQLHPVAVSVKGHQVKADGPEGNVKFKVTN